MYDEAEFYAALVHDTTAYGEAPDAHYVTLPIAGLQFYEYDEHDEIVGQLRPEPGDRLQLVRNPDNPEDSNAIEVWYRDGRVMLGHVPREDAARFAPLIDGGAIIRAYAVHGGNGEPWSAQMILIGECLPGNEREFDELQRDCIIEADADQANKELDARYWERMSGTQEQRTRSRLHAEYYATYKHRCRLEIARAFARRVFETQDPSEPKMRMSDISRRLNSSYNGMFLGDAFMWERGGNSITKPRKK